MWPFNLFNKKNEVPHGRIYIGNQIADILKSVPGFNDKTELTKWDSCNFLGISWREMAKIYAKTTHCGPYKKDVWDCDKYSRLAAAEVNKIWYEMGPDLPLAHGVMYGLLPLDGTSYYSGPHSLCWFLDDEGEFYLYGAIERKIKSPSEVEATKEIWEIAVGG